MSCLKMQGKWPAWRAAGAPQGNDGVQAGHVQDRIRPAAQRNAQVGALHFRAAQVGSQRVEYRHHMPYQEVVHEHQCLQLVLQAVSNTGPGFCASHEQQHLRAQSLSVSLLARFLVKLIKLHAISPAMHSLSSAPPVLHQPCHGNIAQCDGAGAFWYCSKRGLPLPELAPFVLSPENNLHVVCSCAEIYDTSMTMEPCFQQARGGLPVPGAGALCAKPGR